MTTPPSYGQPRGEWPLPPFSHVASLTGQHVSSAPHIREDRPHASSFQLSPCLSELPPYLQVHHVNSLSLPNGALAACLPALSSQTLETDSFSFTFSTS